MCAFCYNGKRLKWILRDGKNGKEKEKEKKENKMNKGTKEENNPVKTGDTGANDT